MIKAIIFDCFGVLTGDMWKEFVATLPADQRSSASDLIRALDSGFISHKEFFSDIEKLTGRLAPEVEAVIDNEIKKNTKLIEYIRKLKVVGNYKLSILSNISTNWITDKLLTSEEASLFDDILPSYQTGMAKPQSGIFELAASRLDVEAKNCIFIDDSPYNVKSAGQVGMKGITYTNYPQFILELEKLLNDSNN